jgi:hypothetical protein
MATLIVALSVGIPSISWAVVRLKAAIVTQQITQQALHECPPAQRASVLRASAELASQLSAERAAKKPISLSFGGRPPSRTEL